jgi:hypothetical protein
MKTISKIAVMALALFISSGLFAQGRSPGHTNTRRNTHVRPAGIKTREDARVNGSLNANAHANEIAKSKANSNSVLNGDQTIAIAHERKHHRRRHGKA